MCEIGGEVLEKIIIDDKEPNERRTKRKAKTVFKRRVINVVVFFICVSIWGGVVYYGYTNAKAYIDTSIQNVQQQNAMNLSDINEQILLLNNEILELRTSIDNTGSSLSDTGSLQKSIDRQLDALEDRLRELEKSLKILQEAP